MSLIQGTDYCGRRFSSSEELLIHLKTHTNLSTSDPVALSATAAATSKASSASSGTSPSRFHPYARPGSGAPPSPSPAVLSPLCLPPSSAGYLNHYATTAAAAAAAASLYPSLFMRPPLM